jgi:uncharacterized NAD-dependent epimerase/dehydratase family protein
MHVLERPYLVFVGDEQDPVAAKTGIGVAHWVREDCVGQWRLTNEAVDLGLPDLSPGDAMEAGARSLLIGVSPFGGALPPHWVASIIAALEAGLNIVSGLHTRLSSIPEIAEASRRTGRQLSDVRHADRTFPVGTGKKRSGRRLLTVGTDCALGKKFTALAITRALKARGVDATFRATGQTGIMIAGSGIAIDAVVADFIAGAAETLSPDAAPDHWDVIEGQGSLFHPAYAGVSLGLLHGSQPDALILCHDPLRAYVTNFAHVPIVPLTRAIELTLTHAHLTNPAAKFVGIALNTAPLGEADALKIADTLSFELGLPCFDPIRFGLQAVVEAILC